MSFHLLFDLHIERATLLFSGERPHDFPHGAEDFRTAFPPVTNGSDGKNGIFETPKDHRIRSSQSPRTVRRRWFAMRGQQKHGQAKRRNGAQGGGPAAHADRLKGQAGSEKAEEPTRAGKLEQPRYSPRHALGRHIGLSISGMARKFLSGQTSHCQNAAVLRGAFSHHRDQLHVPATADGRSPRTLGNGDALQPAFQQTKIITGQLPARAIVDRG